MHGYNTMLQSIALKRFSVFLNSTDYEALCTFPQARRPPLPLQYAMRFDIRRFLDEHEVRAITLAATNPLSKGSMR